MECGKTPQGNQKLQTHIDHRRADAIEWHSTSNQGK